MSESFLNGNVILHKGDCRDVLREIEDDSIDSCCCDPPYHLQSIVKRFGGSQKSNLEQSKDKNLETINSGAFKRLSAGFMGQQWDGGDISFDVSLWAEVLRVLKPGGYIVAFSSSRTYHRMACAIEDAGFITHPMIAWVFGTGFPKAHSVSKHIDRMAGAARDSYPDPRWLDKYPNGPKGGSPSEIVKPASRANDGPLLTSDPSTAAAKQWDGWFYGGQSLKPGLEPCYLGQKKFEKGLNGTQNVLKWGTGAINIDKCRVGTVPRTTNADDKNHRTKSNGQVFHEGFRVGISDPASSRWPANIIHDGSDEILAAFPVSAASKANSRGLQHIGRHGGLGGLGESAARFFFSAKASKRERAGSTHPTVKPIALIRYLVRLVTPPGGLVLDLFAGTGTVGEAAYLEEMRAVLIEREVAYCSDIARRMGLVLAGPIDRANAAEKANVELQDNGPLFRDP